MNEPVLLDIQPAIHVHIARAQRALGQHTPIGTRIVHADIPWTVAVDADIGPLWQPPDMRFRICLCPVFRP